jgi:hypothetical protein
MVLLAPHESCTVRGPHAFAVHFEARSCASVSATHPSPASAGGPTSAASASGPTSRSATQRPLGLQTLPAAQRRVASQSLTQVLPEQYCPPGHAVSAMQARASQKPSTQRPLTHGA